MATTLPRDNAFWEFSLKVYGSPGVADECMALQETLGIDVNLLLFLAWLGAIRRITVTTDEVERADVLVKPWHTQVVRPLRAIRRELKTFVTAGSEAFRTRVKAMEIEAEQIEQAMLFTHSMDAWPRGGTAAPADAAERNIKLYLHRFANGAPISSIAKIIGAATASSET